MSKTSGVLHNGKMIPLETFLGMNRNLEDEHERRVYASAFDRTMRAADTSIDVDAADHNGLLAVRRYRERAGTI